MNKPKVVLVGLGGFGLRHLRVLKELEAKGSCELSSVVDTRSEALHDIAKQGLRVGTALNTLLESCDAVDIVTTTDTHFDIAKKCLNAGKDVFVEKPLASTSSQAGELVRLAEKSHLTLAVGHIFRHHPAIKKVRSLVEEGQIGEISFLDGRYLGSPGPRSDSGALLNLGIHLVDLYSYLLNELPKEVEARCQKFSPSNAFEDYASFRLKYSSAEGNGTVSWLSSQKIRDLILVGGERCVTIDLVANSMFVFDKLKPPGRRIEIDGLEPLSIELSDFLNCVRTRTKPLGDGESAVSAVRTLECAYVSSKTGGAVSID